MQDLNKIQNEFWDKEAAVKEFSDPFYLNELQAYIKPDSHIVEYGCGYGRLLNLLSQNGYAHLSGFDFSQKMIARGKQQSPQLDLHVIEHAAIPLPNASVDAVILSTVLCCVPDNAAQEAIIHEIYRILKPQGVLYLTDFLVTDTEHMNKKYQKDFARFGEWGIYQITEGALVRHYTPAHIQHLLNQFKPRWYHEQDFITMNNNPVKTFHGIYSK